MQSPSDVRTLELKIPPVALVILAALLMWLIAANSPAFHFQFPFRTIASSVIASLGVIIAGAGARQFRRAKTTVNPTKPQSTSSLVKTGIYRRTRNPMYFGFLLILLASAVAMANLIAFTVLPAFVLYMNRFQIAPEERALTTIFGAEFREYCTAARRWI
jgi:protein-S-isoprenylcysteine O-methyltransferase Ste14